MIQVEPQSSFQGFGLGTQQGEYHFSLNMKKSQYGIVPAWAMQASVNSATLAGMGYFNWLAQLKTSPLPSVFGVNSSGSIYQYNGNTGLWALAYVPGIASNGNGLVTDQKNRLIYVGNRYIGKYDPSMSNYTAGTVSVSNGSNVLTGSGTTFTSGMVGTRFQVAGSSVWYTIVAFGSTTGLTLDRNYGETTASGQAYTLFTAWIDKWQDLGAAISPVTQLMPTEIDSSGGIGAGSIFIAYGSNIAHISIVDDSFVAVYFTVPSGMTIVAMKSGINGILIAATLGNRTALILWDGFSTGSIAPWKWVNATVQGIAVNDDNNWVVVTDKNVFFTNGYATPSYIQSAPPIGIPDRKFSYPGFTLTTPQAVAIVDGYLFIANSGVQPYSRVKNCVLALNLATSLWEEITPSTGHTANVIYGAILQDNNTYSFWVSYQTSLPAESFVDTLGNAAPTRAVFISSLFGTANTNNKTAEAVKVELAMNPLSSDTYPITMNVTAEITACKRPLWGFGVTNAIAAGNDQLPCNGTLAGRNSPQVGDEITIMEGLNAGQVRHVLSISNAGLSNQIIQVDSPLPNLTESGVNFNTSPFKLIDKQVLTNLTQLKDLWFNVGNKYQGKKFLVKLVIDSINVVAPELRSISLVYDDLGVM